MNLNERKSLRIRRVALSISLPSTLVEVIDRLADSENIPCNRLLENLIRSGLEAARAKREAA